MQLTEDLEMKLIDSYEAEEGYKKIWKHSQFLLSEMPFKVNCKSQSKIWKIKKTFKIYLLHAHSYQVHRCSKMRCSISEEYNKTTDDMA